MVELAQRHNSGRGAEQASADSGGVPRCFHFGRGVQLGAFEFVTDAHGSRSRVGVGVVAQTGRALLVRRLGQVLEVFGLDSHRMENTRGGSRPRTVLAATSGDFQTPSGADMFDRAQRDFARANDVDEFDAVTRDLNVRIPQNSPREPQREGARHERADAVLGREDEGRDGYRDGHDRQNRAGKTCRARGDRSGLLAHMSSLSPLNVVFPEVSAA